MMSGFFKESLKKTRGYRPFFIMLALLALTELLLHPHPVREAAIRASDRLWLSRYVSSRAEEILPLHQDLAEEPINEAYFRGLAQARRRFKIILVGDSVVWQTPGKPKVPFHHRVAELLRKSFPGKDLAVYSLAMPGMNHVSGFYALKALLRQFRPWLVIYVANPDWLGAVNSHTQARDLGFLSRDFFSARERECHEKLMNQTSAPRAWANWFGFQTVHVVFHIRHGSSLRSLMLPPAVFMGLSSRCYQASCQRRKDIYWRELDLKKKNREQRAKTVQNMQRYLLSDESVNFCYLMLIPELMKAKQAPMIALIPPKNLVMIKELGADPERVVEAGEGLSRLFRKRGVPVSDCTSAVAETWFRDTQHLRARGFELWLECAGPVIVEETERLLSKSGSSNQ